ncbi:MAG: hypothetical protein HOG49_06210 [Candidatus Scalindua sp.]|jgi:hypothetical protein|nr:hypothetical protein [Candidatus Scalindua sp.]
MQREIDIRFYNRSQSWHFVRIQEWDGHKLKASICRNAYDNQSSAKCFKFDGNKWNLVFSMPIQDCKCKDVSYVMKEDRYPKMQELFLLDSETLLEKAKTIID